MDSEIYIRKVKGWRHSVRGSTLGGREYIFRYALLLEQGFPRYIQTWRAHWFDEDGIEETHNFVPDKEEFEKGMMRDYRKMTKKEEVATKNLSIKEGTVWVRKDDNAEDNKYLRVIEVSEDKGFIFEAYNSDMKAEGRIIVDPKRVEIRKFILKNLYREMSDAERAKLLLEDKEFRL